MGSYKLKYTDRGKTGSALQLWQQTYKYMRSANAGSFRSRKTNFDRLSGFVDFVGEEFKLQKIENIKDKHILAYIDHAFKNGDSSSEVWNTVAAVQYLGRQIPGERKFGETSDIKKTYIEQRKAAEPSFNKKDVQRHYIGTGKNPAWTEGERERGTLLALQMKRYDSALSLQFGLALGTRLHETFRQNRNSIGKALETGYLTTKGKGGLIRDIPVNSRLAREVLELAYKQTSSTKERAFVDADQQTHKAMKSVQNWIYNHREKFADSPDRQLTYHGLRHTYAQQEYERIEKLTGNSHEALRQVAEQMGHHREWITKVYLSS